MLFSKNLSISINQLSNFQKDLSKISFPLNISINSFFISIVISLFVSILLIFYFPKMKKVVDPVEFIREIVKLFFLYSGSFFGILYIFRIYSLPRGIILVGILMYPIFFYIFIFILRYEIFKSYAKIKNLIPFLILIVMILIFPKIRNKINDDISVSYGNNTTTTTVFEPKILDADCSPWLGSKNFVGCYGGVKVVSNTFISKSLNNIVVHKQDIYILDVFGRIFKNNSENIFLDISEKVLNRIEAGGESGLFSIAFHPSEEYFLISYSDLEGNLKVDRYSLSKNLEPIHSDIETLIKIPSSANFHYSGNLIWSNFFNDFILSVGDMEQDPQHSSESLDTTSPRGKLLLLNYDVSFPPILSTLSNEKPLNNIIAYGLRNPWKTFEYDNFLFVPDVGESNEEELNILNLNEIINNKSPFLLGWPIYEGTIEKSVYNDILYHSNGTSENITNYIKLNAISPTVYYSHQAPQNLRAAIIGGGVISDPQSKYFENYFFIDFLTAELFAYNFRKNELKMFSLGEDYSLITSLVIHPNKKDTILLSSSLGNIIELNLP